MKTEYVSKDWTVKELQQFIREETNSVNRKLIEYYADNPTPAPQIEQMKNRLVMLGTGKEQKHGGIALGLRGKTKAELIVQARALEEFIQTDIYTPEAMREQEEKFQDQYTKFTGDRPDLQLTESEYKDLVETFGALGDHVLNMWGSEEVAALYNDYAKQEEKPKDFISLMVDAMRDIRNNPPAGGATKESLVDRFRDLAGME